MSEELLIRFLTRRCTSDEIRKVDEWVAEDKANADWLFEMERIWSLKDELRFSDKKEIEDAYSRFISGLQDTGTGKKVRRSVVLPSWIKYAAAIVLIGLLGTNLFFLLDKDTGLTNIVEVPRGQRVALTLSDGTKVWLNSNSKFVYPAQFSSEERDVRLEGEGFFDVTPNPDKPFIIRSGEARVKVLGTSFDFKSYKEDEFIKLTVSTGKVRVNVADQDLQLAVSPNEHLSINKIDGNVRKESIEENNYIKWIHGSLYFNKEPIREVIKTINRTYNRKVILQCKNCDYRITGTHDNKSIEAVIEAICFTTGLRSKREGGNIILYEKH